MLKIDNILEIATHTNYKTTLKLIDIYPQINTTYFWKKKCVNQYKTTFYINTWSGKTNFLVLSKKHFCLNIDFESVSMDGQLYEYDHIYDDLFMSDYNPYKKLIKIEILFKFILVINVSTKTIISSHNSSQEAYNELIKQRYTILSKDCIYEFFMAVIIDIQCMCPRFLGTKTHSGLLRSHYCYFYDSDLCIYG